MLVGIELLFTGLFVVFLVLLFLMYIMEAISWLFGEKSTGKVVSAPQQMVAAPTASALSTDELVAVMAVVGRELPSNHSGVVRINEPQVNGGMEEEQMVVAAIASALAAAGR
jgi:sodium pump decarboxylase gamma subunit